MQHDLRHSGFRYEAGRAGAQHAGRFGCRIGARQDDERYCRMGGAHLRDRALAVHPRHCEIDDREIEISVTTQHLTRRIRVPRLDELHPGIERIELATQSGTNQCVIVRKQDLHRDASIVASAYSDANA